jgi:hypothetical protein
MLTIKLTILYSTLTIIVVTCYFFTKDLNFSILEKNNNNKKIYKFLYITPITDKTSKIFLTQIYKPDIKRIFFCGQNVLNSLCDHRLSNNYTFETLPKMTNEIFNLAYLKYPEIDFFYKFDDDTIVFNDEFSNMEEDVSKELSKGNEVLHRYQTYYNIKETIGIHGFFYGMSRGLVDCSFINTKGFLYNVKKCLNLEDCYTGVRIKTLCKNNYKIINLRGRRFYHRVMRDKNVEINMKNKKSDKHYLGNPLIKP